MTLRTRLALFIAVAIALAVSAQGFFGYLEFQGSLVEDLDRDLGQFVAALTTHIEPGSDQFEDTALLEDYVSRARLRVGNRVVTTLGGRFPEVIATQGADSHSADPHSVGAWRVTSLSLPGYAPDAWLDAAISSRDYTDSLERYRRVALINAGLFAALGALAAAILARGALAPLGTLMVALERVSASGNLSERIPSRGRGELPTLAGAFNAMLERLERFRQREAEFTNNASHELRTPITTMTLSVSAYREGLQSATETITELETELRHMRSLSDSLLLLAREGRTAHTRFDLASQLRASAQRHGASFEGPDHLEFNGNPSLLRRAVENLLENAAKYAPHAQVTVSLEGPLHTTSQQAELRISVSDTGPGMNPELLKRATHPFERGDHRLPGAGLGLSLVQRIAEAHGGRLMLENQMPRGFQACLLLPLSG